MKRCQTTKIRLSWAGGWTQTQDLQLLQQALILHTQLEFTMMMLLSFFSQQFRIIWNISMKLMLSFSAIALY